MHYNNSTYDISKLENPKKEDITRLVCIQIFYSISYNWKHSIYNNGISNNENERYESSIHSPEFDIETQLIELIGSDFQDFIDTNTLYSLLAKTIKDSNTYCDIINNHLKNWTLERVDILKISVIKIFITDLLLNSRLHESNTQDNNNDKKEFISSYLKIARLFYSDIKTVKFFTAILNKIYEEIEKKFK